MRLVSTPLGGMLVATTGRGAPVRPTGPTEPIGPPSLPSRSLRRSAWQLICAQLSAGTRRTACPNITYARGRSPCCMWANPESFRASACWSFRRSTCSSRGTAFSGAPSASSRRASSTTGNARPGRCLHSRSAARRAAGMSPWRNLSSTGASTSCACSRRISSSGSRATWSGKMNPRPIPSAGSNLGAIHGRCGMDMCSSCGVSGLCGAR